ncbi:MAG: hypothetical protein H0W68_12345 [Gemmatimonadaceae bacterium]|nr:hypothetical protein [Gemmatimonadaceae bacterium]
MIVIRRTVLALAVTAACQPRAVQEVAVVPAGQPARVAGPDTARGVVLRVGSDPGSRLVLRPAGGGADVALAGDALGRLLAAERLEVMVRGRTLSTQTGAAPMSASVTFDADEFIVRAVDGTAVEDGVLTARGSDVMLRRSDGTMVAVPHLPSSLRGAVGARVWLAGPLDRAPAAYGTLVTAP